MKISKEEILHIANLADLNIDESEIENYILNLQDILEFAKVIDNIPTEEINNIVDKDVNIFRKDEIQLFKDCDLLLQNAKDVNNNMFKIPKVI